MSISGNLRTMPFADLLQWVSQSRKTGTLAVEGNPYNKKIYFRDGLVVAASSENPKEFLGYYLVGWGFLGEEELGQLLDMQDRHGTLLGELLVIIGRLSREELVHILGVKTEETIFELFLWEQGDFRFLENILPAKKFQPLNMPVDTIILEGVRRKDEWERSRTHIPDALWRPKLVRAVDVQQLGPTELSILREINGNNSIEEIALACRLALFHVLNFVYQGSVHGLFKLLPPREEEVTIPGFSEGSWRVLVKQAERLIAEGDLKGANRRIVELREKYSGHREVEEHTAGLQRTIDRKMDELDLPDDVVLEVAVPFEKLTSLSCSPQEGFLLSRINGSYRLGEVMTMVPYSTVEVRLMVDSLVRRRILRARPAGTSSKDARAG